MLPLSTSSDCPEIVSSTPTDTMLSIMELYYFVVLRPSINKQLVPSSGTVYTLEEREQFSVERGTAVHVYLVTESATNSRTYTLVHTFNSKKRFQLFMKDSTTGNLSNS